MSDPTTPRTRQMADGPVLSPSVRLAPSALVVVKPDTLVRWHRRGFRLFWRWEVQTSGKTLLYPSLQGADPGRWQS